MEEHLDAKKTKREILNKRNLSQFKNITMKLYFIIILGLLCHISCNQEKKQTLITGNIPNLPDGIMYLYEDNGTNKIDSIQTKKGKFNFIYHWKNNEPVYLGLNHVDNHNIFTYIGFPTKAKYKGAPLEQTRFLSDSTIIINGKTFDNTPTSFPENVKSITLFSPIITGKQTDALYHIDEDLFEHITPKTVSIIKEKLIEYPFSYHLLYKISENKNSFSALQTQDLLHSFKGEITESNTYKKLYAYNEKRFNEKNILLPLLENNRHTKEEILNKKYKKHLIVFWASWCGPCRQEIPLLKKTFASYAKETEFISISIDEDQSAWQKALAQENMSWKQLIADKKNSAYETLQIRFKLNGAIPYTVLVDNDLHIIASSTGLSSEKDLVDLIKK
ncbi:AhpC/TSA family protein [Chryseobacterium sp. GMJ5]|uniref:AhpC/TSA family protein n=1 Tax=Chryseobacterium gilvum TaxID=2976534 RepID=A0ABT2VSY1_9FLAO|nr:TlpA disulfide reductase family protein [Chryseobacterium gilvum]MCU7613102.1 AhpC/TSA family protein [Chryseobacterium gilvum]